MYFCDNLCEGVNETDILEWVNLGATKLGRGMCGTFKAFNLT